MREIRTGDVAKLFRVTPKTVKDWCTRQFLSYERLPGARGHRRFFEGELRAFANKHELTVDWSLLAKLLAEPARKAALSSRPVTKGKRAGRRAK